MSQDAILGYFYLRMDYSRFAAAAQDLRPGTFSVVPYGTSRAALLNPGLTPDFLHAALDRSAYAAFFTESRMGLSDSTKLHRKSGSVLGYSQPSLRDSNWRG
jgi:hypothetical protein